MVRPTRLTTRLASGAETLGVLSGRFEPALIEESAYAGFDFYVVDVEHTSVSDTELAECVRAGDAAGIPVLARLGPADLPRVPHFLDAGGDGIILAQVSCADDLDRLIQLACFPPVGRRGAGTTRVARHGFEPTTPQWLADQNHGLFVGALVEDALEPDALDEVVAHPRVSAVFIGARDLSLQLGVAGQMAHPLVSGAIGAIETACERHEVLVARLVREVGNAAPARLRMIGLGTMMQEAVRTLRG